MGDVSFEVVASSIGLLVAGIVVIALLFFLKDTTEDTIFEKNYIARDLAMMATTA